MEEIASFYICTILKGDSSPACVGFKFYNFEIKKLYLFYFERFAVDWLATLTRASRIASLRNEVLNNPVKYRAIVVALHAELHKVPTRLGRLLWPELDLYLAQTRIQHHL